MRIQTSRPAAVLLGILLAWGGTASQLRAGPPTVKPADGEAPVHGGPLQRAREILDGLGLSPDQKAKIDALFADAKEQAQKLRQAMQDATAEERNQKMRDFLTEQKARVEAVLTPEQRDQFEKKLMADHPGGQMNPAERVKQMLQQLRDSLGELTLSNDQKAKVDSVLQDTTSKLQQLRDVPDEQDRKDKFREIMGNTREQLRDILTPEQQVDLRDKMQSKASAKPEESPPSPPPPATKPAEHTIAKPPPHAPDSPAKPIRPAPAATVAAKPPEIGSVAANFSLSTLDGTLIQLSSLRGRVISLVFGSYSCPNFRQAVPALERLNLDLGTRATIFIVYTKEAHPDDGWQVARNREENILIKQPTTEATRRAIAGQAKSFLHMRIPILTDSMDDAATTSYAGFPNSAVVINRDGTIASYEEWVDPDALRRQIDQAVGRAYHSN